ncbi:MAG: hypothetical protein KGJ06_06325 [Pseudomonadota bacterium]|nr:hypothetical protein [Pseudomonadota bacterium]
MITEELIEQGISQLGMLSEATFGYGPQTWHYDRTNDTFVLPLSTGITPEEVVLVNEFIEDITTPSVFDKRITKIASYMPPSPKGTATISIKAGDIDFDELRKSSEERIYDTPVYTPPRLSPVQADDIPLLEGLGVADHFSKNVTDGKWRIVEIPEEERTVARLILKLPPSSKMSISLAASVPQLQKDLDFSARDSHDSSHLAAQFELNRAQGHAARKYGVRSNGKNGLNVYYLDVSGIDREHFEQKKGLLKETIQHYGAFLEKELSEIKSPLFSHSPLRRR